MLPLLADRWSLDGIAGPPCTPAGPTPLACRSRCRGSGRSRDPVLRDDAEGADTSVWLVAAEPAPPTGLFWHDRRARPIDLVPSTRASQDARTTAWAWLTAAAGLTSYES